MNCSLLVYDLFMLLFITCSWLGLVQDLFMTWSQLVYDSVLTCSGLVHHLFMTCLWVFHNLFTSSLWFVQDLFITCSGLIHDLVKSYSKFVFDFSMTCPCLVYDLLITCSWHFFYAILSLFFYFTNSLELLHLNNFTWPYFRTVIHLNYLFYLTWNTSLEPFYSKSFHSLELLTLLPLNYFSLFTSIEVIHLSH